MQKLKTAVLLCGGEGTRLRPLTNAINKSLLTINGKAIIDYPLNTLKQLGCENVIITLGGPHFDQVVNYLKNGADFGLNISYVYQGVAEGISHAVSLCEKSLVNEEIFAVMLADNIYDQPVKFIDFDISNKAQVVLTKPHYADLKRFGVASIKNNKIVKIEEKPQYLNQFYDNYAISGLYLFDYSFFDLFKQTKKSARDEFEVTDILSLYLKHQMLDYVIYDDLWADAGLFETINHLNHHFYTKK